MRPALHLERYLAVVVDDDGADIEAVGRHGGKAEDVGIGHDDGAAVGETVGGRTGGCRDDEPVGLVGHQILAVDAGAHGNHRGIVALEHGDVVEGEGAALDYLAVGLDHDDGMGLHSVVPVCYLGDGVVYLVGMDVGQKSQSACVDTDYGRRLASHHAGCAQKGAVAADGDDEVYVEVVVVEDAAYLDLHAQGRCDGPEEGALDVDFGSTSLETVYEPVERYRLTRLELLAEESEPQHVCRHKCYLFLIFVPHSCSQMPNI